MEHTRPRFRPPTQRNGQDSSPLSTFADPESSQASLVATPSPKYPIFTWKENITPGTKIEYLRQIKDVNEALESVQGPFGFDIEWRPSFIKGRPESPVALLQLACQDQIFLIHLSEMNGFPGRLQDVLEDHNILKAGVGIGSDAKKLWRDCGVSLLGAVELSQLARIADPLQWPGFQHQQLISLSRLTEAYKQQRLDKSNKVKLSNWERRLTDRQKDYAASDALAGFLIYQHLLGLNPSALPEDYTSNFIGGKCEPYGQYE